jgi:hypothetical protein
MRKQVRSRHINYIFWGLMLAFIDINIGGFDILNDSLGLLIVTWGLYCLRGVSRKFSYAMWLALADFAWTLVCFVIGFGLVADRWAVFTFLLIGAGVLNTAMLWCIMSALSEQALAQGRESLASRLKHGVILYLITWVLSYGALAFSALVLMIIVICFVIYCVILCQIRAAYQHLDAARFTGVQTALQPKPLLMFLLLGGLSMGVGIGSVAWVEYSPIETERYERDSAGLDVADIRAKLQALGVAQAIAEDLPDSELDHYRSVETVQPGQVRFNGNVNDLEITLYYCWLGKQNYRILWCYTWLQTPKPAHAEAMGFSANNHDVLPLHENSVFSLNLFDLNGKTYRVSDIQPIETDHIYTSNQDNAVDFFAQMQVSLQNAPDQQTKKFKFPYVSGGDHYRGYLSCDLTLASNENDDIHTWWVYYSRQKTIFNNLHQDISLITGVAEPKTLLFSRYTGVGSTDTRLPFQQH